MAGHRGEPPSELDAARIQAEQIHPAAREPEGVTRGSGPASAPVDRRLVDHIAKAAGAPVPVPDFRRAPEHKYPAQVDDAEAAFNWLS
ncbi:alpha/beta hydrolase fold domain-containing protein [Streptomyces canus]|uniref:alpha/beta hydrolase fold domain-containing protein n=1 Tax=Streptomyces canus TaxID=58343 RepID=UPI0032502072